MAYAIALRAPYIGILAYDKHQWLSAATWIFVDNWQYDGWLNDWGLMLESPRSVMEPTIHDRSPYVSYAPGAALEIFLLKKILPDISTISIIHVFNIINQYIISFILAKIILAVCHTHPMRYLFAGMVAITYILHPHSLYYHSMVFFADQAVLLPICLALWCETHIRSASSHSQKLHIFQLLLLAIATLMEWTGLITAIFLFLFRIISPTHRTTIIKNIRSAGLWLFSGPVIIILLWALQVYFTDTIDLVEKRFLLRTDSLAFFDTRKFFIFFNSTPMFGYIFKWDAVLLLISLIYFSVKCIRHPRDVINIIALIIILVPVAHTFIFPHHAQIHSFTVLKYIMPLSLVSYGLMPLSMIADIQKLLSGAPRRRHVSYVLITLFSGIWLSTAHAQHQDWQSQFPQYDMVHKNIASWLKDNADYHDVFISREITLDVRPPQIMAIARHRIFQYDTPSAYRKALARLPIQANIYAVASGRMVKKCKTPEEYIGTRIREPKRVWHVVRLGNVKQLSSEWKKCLIRPQHSRRKNPPVIIPRRQIKYTY